MHTSKRMTIAYLAMAAALLEEIMSAQKPSVAPREPVLNINVSKVAQYFPTGCTKQQMENRILKILESYFRQMAHEQAHEEER